MTIGDLRIGSRGSKLALWQAEHFSALLRQMDTPPTPIIVVVKTQGDQNREDALWNLSGRSFFTKAIDEKLVTFEIDAAVHSMKDMETKLPDGLVLGCVLARDDPRDCLITKDGLDLADLPAGARIGTSSLRRRAFLLNIRPDLNIGVLRGNVQTRLQSVKNGEFDGVILATAGLKRLGLLGDTCRPLPREMFPPAVAQGAIGIVCRIDDKFTLGNLCEIDDKTTRMCVTAERMVLKRLDGGCHAPVGVHCYIEGEELKLFARICSPDGKMRIDSSASLPVQTSEGLAKQVAQDLIRQGARDIIDSAREQMQATSA